MTALNRNSVFIMSYINIVTLLFSLFILFSASVSAGFLEMPGTEEVPEYEKKTLLLDLDVPSVRERDPDPQGGPRLNIQEFRVQGIVEYPKLGITREALIKRVEEIRFDIMQEGKLLDSGYSLDELGELSDLLGNIEEETKGEHVSPVEVQRLVFLIREQRRERGVTLGMIESVADVITRFYRERGFILAKAYIPEQHVRDGVVTLTLLLGELGEVDIHENKRYSERTIARVFNSDMGKPVITQRVEERLYLINDLPGLSARGYFEPGSQVGDTKLNINVLSEKWYSANIRMDNHGAPGSGEYRLYADGFVYNPFGFSDQLQLGVLASFEPMNSTYGLIRYQTNIVHPRLGIYMGASTNSFVLDSVTESSAGNSTSFKASGKSAILDAGFNFKLKRTRVQNYSVDFGISEVESKLGYGEQVTNSASSLDIIRNTTLSFSMDKINERKRRLHQATISFVSSQFVEGAEAAQKESVLVFEYDYALLTFIPLPFTDAESRLLFRSAGQYAGYPVSTSIQFGLGGPMRARGFNVDGFFADDGVYFGVDWLFSGPGGDKIEFFGERLKNIMQPYLYVDSAYGHKYPLLADNVSATYANVGFGIKLNFREMRGNLAFSMPIVNEVADGFDEELPKEMKMFFDLQYSF